MADRHSRNLSFAEFATVARRVAEHARALGLVAPAFRSPPRVAGADRTLRRAAVGGVVAVRLAGRARDAVVADLVEGVVAVNRLAGDEATRARAVLVESVATGGAPRAA